jgi:hypothetical protein
MESERCVFLFRLLHCFGSCTASAPALLDVSVWWRFDLSWASAVVNRQSTVPSVRNVSAERLQGEDRRVDRSLHRSANFRDWTSRGTRSAQRASAGPVASYRPGRQCVFRFSMTSCVPLGHRIVLDEERLDTRGRVDLCSPPASHAGPPAGQRLVERRASRETA